MRNLPLHPVAEPIERRQSRRRATDHPELRLIRLPEVQEISALARSSVYEAIRDGAFPPPVKPYGRTIRWVNLEIQDWLAQRLHARQQR